MNVLLSVVGMTPQVLTETLYAIHMDNKPWPDHIRVVTTLRGRQTLQDTLIKGGYLEALCDEYARPMPRFTEQDVVVITDVNGREVDDARTVEDHEVVADCIVDEVRRLTCGDGTHEAVDHVHASLAGGRKTMTFYLGYAMSLFGRHSDMLSHVLVDEPYESVPEFFFKTRQSKMVTNRAGQQLDCAEGEIVLADIPFLRHRDQLPASFKQLSQPVSFRKMINLINVSQDPKNLKVVLKDSERQMLLYQRGMLLETIDFNILEYAFYRMMISANKNEEIFVRPEKDEPDTDLSFDFMEMVYLVMGWVSNEEELDEYRTLSLSDIIDRTEELIDETSGRVRIRASTYSMLNGGVNDGFFAARINKIKSNMEKNLPPSLVRILTPTSLVDPETGIKQESSAMGASDTGRSNKYGLATNLDVGQFIVMSDYKG